MKNLFFLYLTVYFYLAFLRSATGHGRLWEPPARSTLFRRGYSTTPNYNDNQLFCGGYAVYSFFYLIQFSSLFYDFKEKYSPIRLFRLIYSYLYCLVFWENEVLNKYLSRKNICKNL